MGLICIGYITDPHIPFHSRRAVAATLNCLADSRLSALYLGGDILDMYWCHGHGAKHPSVFSTFKREKEEGCKFLDQLDLTWPDIPKVFIEGNHETRFERWLVQNAPQLFGVTDMRIILEMEKRKNWTYHDFNTRQLVRVMDTNLFAKHAPKGSSGSTIMNKAACNMIFGHVHRIIDEHRVTGDGRRLQVFSPGWLGDIRNDQVFGYVPGHHDWQSGFAKIWIDTETNHWWIEGVQIKNGQCVSEGKIYKG